MLLCPFVARPLSAWGGDLLVHGSVKNPPHGQDVKAPNVARIARRARDDHNFHRVPRKGTERMGGLYMPLYTEERHSRCQLADIRAYLASLR